MTKLIRLLSLVLLLSGVRVAAQTRVAALRDFKQVWDSNHDNPRGFYFEDQHHDLDKFAGEWEGAGLWPPVERTYRGAKKGELLPLLLVGCSWLRTLNRKGW